MALKDDKVSNLRAGPGNAGVRLDKFLADALPDLSRTRIKSLIKDSRVVSSGATIADPSYRVKPGEAFDLTIPRATPALPRGQAIALDVVYEDAALIVVNKPAGMVVHPAAGNPDSTLVNALIAHCGDSLSGIGGVMRPGIVHRLDKDTSGLMVAAKTDAAHQGLTSQFASRSLSRVYQALVWGLPSPTAGRIEGNIGRSPQNRKKMAVVSDGGRAAVTHYRVLRVMESAASLVECCLETGRTHQIRVHLAHIGNPVIGDPVYGRAGGRRRAALSPQARDTAARFSRQALHAWSLTFDHPTSGETLSFESALPRDMEQLIAAFATPRKAR
ncbi:MAG: RluA family pseudouridine synthase [Alphaproteobacteria bacterium]